VNIAVIKKIMYTVVIQDYIPDIVRGVACRKLKNTDAERRKYIKCPCCNKQLTAVAATTKVELHKYPRKTDVLCHEYRKCNSCSETIGFIFTLG